MENHTRPQRSRTAYMVKNTAAGFVSQAVGLLLTFVSRTVFIYYLGNSFLGINSLYTEILSFLSFAQLGIGSAITFALYAPIARSDEEKIVQLLMLYKKVYRIIALVILGLGLALIPFLQHIVKGADGISLFNLRLYFVFFLIDTVSSYFLAYKNSYITATQKNYVVTHIATITQTVTVLVQICVIVISQNYLVYLASHTVLGLISKIIQYIYLEKYEPIFKRKASTPLPKEDKKKIYKDVKALVFHQLASVAVNSTDNIIISSVKGLGILTVGLVSNYNLIITHVSSFVSILFNSVTAGFGNLVASSSKEHYHKTFCDINFVNFWVYGFCSVAFFVLIPPFITLWIGSDYLIDMASLLLIVISRYILGQTVIYNYARVAKGRFDKDYWISIVEALINLVVSVIAANRWGLVGVYFGTLVSKVFYIILRPIVSYKFLYGKSSLDYFRQLISYFLATCLAGVITYALTYSLLLEVTVWKFVLSVAITAIVPNIIFALLFFKTKSFYSVLGRIKGLLSSKFNKG